jgi:L-seryl-tRNA(Ser) seleniumtransferase
MNELKKAGDSTLRVLPSVDQLLRSEAGLRLRQSIGVKRLTAIARLVTAEIRASLRNSQVGTGELDYSTAETVLARAVRLMEETAQRESSSGIRNVINATGVLLHTNLGRAPLSRAACIALTEKAGRYCTLEYDAATGLRGKRGARVEALLQSLTGAEDALVVNNCAAAALLILAVLAGDGETLVSRGELVEIGGDFRVPDVMASSGTRMVEVGTTNKTNLDDYRKAINPNTRLIMCVYPSNYRIVGFASTPRLSELVELARMSGIPFYEDAGSGQLTDLSRFGVVDEPNIGNLIADGADVVSFSGDKLIGSAQAGLIVGKRVIVSRLRNHPLYRALRSDKLRLTALEATLSAHQRDVAAAEIPVIQMLALTKREIEDRASVVIEQISDQTNLGLRFELLDGDSAVGGGAGPTSQLRTTLIAITHGEVTAQEIEILLRSSAPPIIGRIAEGKVLLDLRTVFPDEDQLVVQTLRNLCP